MRFVSLLILGLGGVWCFITFQAIRRWPLKELRKLAGENHDSSSSYLVRLSEFGFSGRFLLWLVGSGSLADLLFILYRHVEWLAGLVAMAAIGLIFIWQPLKRPSGILWTLAGWLAAILSQLLSLVQPAALMLNRWSNRFSKIALPDQIYEKADLAQLLRAQSSQAGNRISDTDLKRARAVLAFSDKTVGQIMQPRREITWIEAREPVGPAIMDELHKLGQPRFALVKSVKSSNPEIIGTLYIGDLLKHLGRQAKLRDLMHPGGYYVNEANSLEEALVASLKTGSQLLVVVNGRQEITGLLSIERLLFEALGPLPETDFHDYNDRRLVAEHQPHDLSE